MRKLGAIAFVAALGGCDVNFSVGGNGSETTNQTTPSATRRFVNSQQNARSDFLREHYTDFSFEYPSDWAMPPQSDDGDAQNYVRVQGQFVDGYEPFQVSVGATFGTGDAAYDQQALAQYVPQFAEQFGQGFQNYRVVSVGPEQVGRYRSEGFRFTASGPGQNGGAPVQIYGRVDFVLPPGATKGIAISIFATSRTTEVTSAEQVGESGTLRAILDSFQVGNASAGSQPNPAADTGGKDTGGAPAADEGKDQTGGAQAPAGDNGAYRSNNR